MRRKYPLKRILDEPIHSQEESTALLMKIRIEEIRISFLVEEGEGEVGSPVFRSALIWKDMNIGVSELVFGSMIHRKTGLNEEV